MLVRRFTMIVVGLAMALVLLPACSDDGGGDGAAPAVTPGTYVKSLCTTVQSYVDDITTLSTDFAAGIDPAASAEDQKQAVLDFLDDAIALTDALIDQVDAAGVPDVEGGAAMVEAIAASFQDARQVLEDARARVEAASTEDPQSSTRSAPRSRARSEGSVGRWTWSTRRSWPRRRRTSPPVPRWRRRWASRRPYTCATTAYGGVPAST
jgi:hypothetical protein